MVQDFTPVTTGHRWWRFFIGASGQWDMGQWYLTDAQTTTIGPDPSWQWGPTSNVIQTPFPSHTATMVLAADRYAGRFRYNHLDGTDLAVFDDLWTAAGLARGFYFDGPDDSESARFMKLTDRPLRTQDSKNPKGEGATYRIDLSMLEEIG
jgi:hypothetical protein